MIEIQNFELVQFECTINKCRDQIEKWTREWWHRQWDSNEKKSTGEICILPG